MVAMRQTRGFLFANSAGKNVNPNPMETSLIGFFSKPLVRKSTFTPKNEILIWDLTV